MYKIMSSDGTVLYDGSAPDSYAVSQGHCTREVGQAGSLAFTMSDPEDELYDSVGVMETYLSALDDDDEIFYGRVIDIDVNPITGEKQIQCAGALSFLEDGEIPPFSDSSGQTMTAREFLELCVNAYNADIDDDERRAFTVGTVSHSQASASRTYVISSYTKAKSALENNLLGEYGGYFRARREDGILFLDWLEAYDESNASPITMTENLISQENAFTSNDLVTMIRPVGKNGITLPEDTIAISNSLVQRYGRIVANVGFSTAETSTALRAKAEEYISRLSGGLGKTCTVKVIDMHYIDGTVPKIRLCSTYTDLEGFDGEDMVAASIDQDFMDPSNDTVTFKNARELTASTRKSGSGGIGKSTGRGNFTQNITNLYKHISETDDTLNLFADRININAIQIVEYAQEFDQFATATSGAIDNINGTGVLQNSDHIVQAAGNFTRRYMLISQAKKEEVKTAGGSPHAYGWYIANDGYVVQETDVNSGIELYDSIESALQGNSIPTASLKDVVGQTRVRMQLTTDTEVDLNKNYYTRTLAVTNGTSVVISENGHEVTIGEELDTITGSALWTQRDNITGIVGDFQVVYDSETGERRLVVLTGGGMSIRKDNVEYGLYDSGTLTAGILVEKLSDGVHTGTIDSQYYDDEYIEEKVTIYGDIIKLDVKNAVITETSTYIRAEVGAAASNIAYSVIEQAASYIRMEVSNAASSISESVIEQTSEYIESVVADVASGVAWSVISQTMTGIIQEVGRKSKIYRQWTNPNDGVNVLHDGDIWVKIMMRETWDDAASMTWDEASQYKWRDFYSVRQFVWSSEKNDWVQIVDTAPIIESTVDVELDNEHWAVVAHQLDLNQQAYDSNLSVTAQRINSDVSTAKSQIYSTIAQTATNITSQVANVQTGLTSKIEQTESRITSAVADTRNGLVSMINQTATNISSTVANVREGLVSQIEQTAGSITSNVRDVKNGLESMIKQTATGVYSTVWNRTASTYSTIQQTSDSISLSVNAAKTAMGSLIMITATGVYSTVWNRAASTYSTILQTATSIAMAVTTAKTDMGSLIMVTATGVYNTVWNSTASTYSTFRQTAESISAAVGAAQGDLESMILRTATHVYSTVWDKTENTYSTILQTSTLIATRVAKDDVISSINQTAESVTINASKINLNGYARTSELNTDWLYGKIAAIANVSVQNLSSTRGGVSVYSVATTSFSQGGVSCYLPNAVSALQVVSSGNNAYKIQKKTFGSDTWTDVPGTFSRAVGSFSVGGGSGKINVTANPQGQSVSIPVTVYGPSEIVRNGTYSYEADYENTSGDDNPIGGSATKSITVNVPQGDYNSGWTDCVTSGVKLNATGIVTINPGETSNVYLQAKETPSSSSYTNKYYRQVKARSVILQTKTVTANGTYTAGSGNDGLGTVYVAVPSGVTPTLSGSWDSARLTVASTPAASQNYIQYFDSTIGAIEGQTGYYAYARRYTNVQSPSYTRIAGSHHQVTITNSDNNNVKLQLSGVDTGLTYNHGKYNSGWSNCITSGVKLSATGIVTINPGETSNVYLQAKETPSSSSYTNKYYRTVKARSVILQTKTITANGSYSVDQGQGDGLGTVYVAVSGGTTSDISIWEGNNRAASATITSAHTYTAWAQVNGAWTEGSSITITPSIASLTGFWNSGIYTVKPTGFSSPTRSIGFSGSANVHIAVQTNGVPTITNNPRYVSAPMKIVEMQSSAEPIERHTFSISINAGASYNAGVDAGFDSVTGNDITLCGNGDSPQASKPTFAGTWTTLSTGKKRLSAYIWAKHKDTKWYKLRSFSFTEP